MKINFFRKIYFSIFKIKEYGNLAKLGMKKSINYIMDLILICSIIYASILTFQMKKNANGLQEYLEQNFPNITYKESVLTSEVKDRVVLDDKLVKANFGGKLVVDTITDYDILINEYKNLGESTILLTSNKYVTINSQGVISEYNYEEIIQRDNGEDITIGKEYFINIFGNISYSYYFVGYFIGSCIGTSIIIFTYNLFISGVAFIVCKIKKVKTEFSEIYIMGLYAHTISAFGYFIMNFLGGIAVYIQILSFLIPIGYLAYAIYTNKWIMPEKG